jgi:predicted RNase H-like HicB family nuclease
MGASNYSVFAAWDSEAKVWYVSDSDVPGLAAEADSVEKLLARLNDLIPELLAENGVASPSPVSFSLTARKTNEISRNAA